MNWNRLEDCSDVNFWRGVVFRFPANKPFEQVVDFMMIEDLDSDSGYKLICSSGYHAGQTELVLPKESSHKEGGISVSWLKENWKKWVYPECELAQVKYLTNYPPGEL